MTFYDFVENEELSGAKTLWFEINSANNHTNLGNWTIINEICDTIDSAPESHRQLLVYIFDESQIRQTTYPWILDTLDTIELSVLFQFKMSKYINQYFNKRLKSDSLYHKIVKVKT